MTPRRRLRSREVRLGPFGAAATATVAPTQDTDGNNGFLLRERTGDSATSYEQQYYDRQHATYTPSLVLTWG